MSNELSTKEASTAALLIKLTLWIGQEGDWPNGKEWEKFASLPEGLREQIADLLLNTNITEIPKEKFTTFFPFITNESSYKERLATYITFVSNLVMINIGLIGDEKAWDVGSLLSQLPSDIKEEYLKTVAVDAQRGILSKPPHFSWCLSPDDKEPTLVEKVKAYISLKKSVKRDEEDTITIRRSSYNALRDYVKKVQFHHKIYTLDNVLAVTQLDTKEDPTLELLKNTFNAFSTLTAEADMVLLHTKE